MILFFISFKDHTRPLEISILRSWVRSMLSSTGISASPGSVRSAAASYMTLAGNAMEDVLQQGDWAGLRTLQRHYLRSVANSSRPVDTPTTSKRKKKK